VFHSKNILVFDNAIKQHVYVFCPRNYLLRMHSIKGRGVPGRQCGQALRQAQKNSKKFLGIKRLPTAQSNTKAKPFS
jgi:hypothetical protein